MIPSDVVAGRAARATPVAQLKFSGLSESVVSLLDKFIFRHHRRMVAGAKLAAGSFDGICSVSLQRLCDIPLHGFPGVSQVLVGSVR